MDREYAANEAALDADREGGAPRDGDREVPRDGEVTGLPAGGRNAAGVEHASPAETTPAQAAGRPGIPLLQRVQEHRRVSSFLAVADELLEVQGFTEHGTRHARLVGHIAYNVLSHLDHDPRTAELAAVAGYLHDIGNVVSRTNHPQSSGLIAIDVLEELDVTPRDIARVIGAIGRHEDHEWIPPSPEAAAVILADKSDVHRSRVRKDARIEMDIHDRVNYAAESSFLRVDPEARTITLELVIDTAISDVLEYFEIFLQRMIMCRRAARSLDCDFRMLVNGADLL